MHDVRRLQGDDLSRDELAEFAGGFLYGASRHTIDQRTELTGEFWIDEGVEGCYLDCGRAIRQLD